MRVALVRSRNAVTLLRIEVEVVDPAAFIGAARPGGLLQAAIHELLVVAGSSQSEAHIRRREPAIRRCAEAKLSSASGRSGCGREREFAGVPVSCHSHRVHLPPRAGISDLAEFTLAARSRQS